MENTSTSTQVPPGFRFHPTDEELVDYYLRRKVNSTRNDLDVIKEVDLYKIEPWDLQELCKMGNEEQSEWYFFSHKDKKYPTGTRTNRATTAGFWKATGRDKAIYSKHELVGMRKTLVFYKGRAPNGQKSDWIMHEYRLETDENGVPQEEGWVVCRVFKKRTTSTMRNHATEHDSSCWYDDQLSFIPNLDSPKHTSQSNNLLGYTPYTCKKELDYHLPFQIPQQHLIHLPNILDNSKLLLSITPHAISNNCNNSLVPYGLDINQHGNSTVQQFNDTHNGAMMSALLSNTSDDQGVLDQVTDWRVLDKFVASQLSQEDVPKGNSNNYSSSTTVVSDLAFPNPMSEHSNKDESMLDNASTSTTSSQIDAWK